MGETEADHLVRLTDAQLRYGDIAWLEVGAGDGKNLRFQLGRLAANRRFHAVALEPSLWERPAEGVEWLRVKAEDYRPDRVFDWVNVRHSAYYIVNLIAEFSRLSNALSEDGAIALTHWSRDCILRRIHIALCGDDGQAPTSGIEDLARQLTDSGVFTVSHVTMTETALDVEKALGDAAVAAALSRLVQRGKKRQDESLDAAEQIATLLRRLPESSRRRNGIVIIRPITR